MTLLTMKYDDLAVSKGLGLLRSDISVIQEQNLKTMPCTSTCYKNWLFNFCFNDIFFFFKHKILFIVYILKVNLGSELSCKIDLLQPELS